MDPGAFLIAISDRPATAPKLSKLRDRVMTLFRLSSPWLAAPSARDALGGAGSAHRQIIARAPGCPDWTGVTRGAKRLAQSADLHVDGALVDIRAAAPHQIAQLRARKNVARLAHQTEKDRESALWELDFVSRPPKAACRDINFNVALRENRARHLSMRGQSARLALEASSLYAKLRGLEFIANDVDASRWHCIPPGVVESNASITGLANRLSLVQRSPRAQPDALHGSSRPGGFSLHS